MVGARRTAARRQRASEPAADTSPAGALVTAVARALGLERAALLVDDGSTPGFTSLASIGACPARVARPEAPAGGPWSAVLPIEHQSRTVGLLLLALPDGAPLPPDDVALAEGLAASAAALFEAPRLRAELEHAQELLTRSDRLAALGMLAAGVAHEIRNPLVSVQTFIQLLPERLQDEEFLTRFRSLALAEIERICGLITDLLGFTRVTPAQREPVDMPELIGQVVRLLDLEARREGVVLSHDCAGDLRPVVVDDGQIRQVLLNLALNAIQAGAPRGTVEISAYPETIAGREWCCVSVSDTGPGIAPEDRPRIFEPFFTTKENGSGLGLFLVQQIVTAHGGVLRVASQEPCGSVFSIHLPVIAGEADAR